MVGFLYETATAKSLVEKLVWGLNNLLYFRWSCLWLTLTLWLIVQSAWAHLGHRGSVGGVGSGRTESLRVQIPRCWSVNLLKWIRGHCKVLWGTMMVAGKQYNGNLIHFNRFIVVSHVHYFLCDWGITLNITHKKTSARGKTLRSITNLFFRPEVSNFFFFKSYYQPSCLTIAAVEVPKKLPRWQGVASDKSVGLVRNSLPDQCQ